MLNQNVEGTRLTKKLFYQSFLQTNDFFYLPSYRFPRNCDNNVNNYQ